MTRYLKKCGKKWRMEKQTKLEWQKQKQKKEQKEKREEEKRDDFKKPIVKEEIEIARVIEEKEEEEENLIEIRTVMEIVPRQFHKYLKVFEKKKSERMLIRKTWDYTIDLREEFVPKRERYIHH